MNINPLLPPESNWGHLRRFDWLALKQVRDIEQVSRVFEEADAHAASLGNEAFLGVHNQHAELYERPAAGLSGSYSLLKRAEQMPEFQALRRHGSDPTVAALATATFVRELVANLPEQVKDELENLRDAQNEEDNVRAQMEALGPGAGMPAGGEGDAEGYGEQSSTYEDLLEALSQAEARTDAAAQSVEQALDSTPAQVERAMARSAGEALDEIENINQSAQALGYSLSASSTGKPVLQKPEDLLRIVEFLKKNTMLKQIVDLLGWAESLIRGEMQKNPYGRDHFVDYRTHAFDLESLAPMELISLADEGGPLGADFERRFLAGQLLHAHYEGEEEQGKGPVVIVRDTSGSMKQFQRHQDAVALEHATVLQLNEQGRRWASIPFSGPGQFKVFDPGPNPALSQVLDHLGFGYWGGTEPYAPMLKAMEIIESAPTFREGCILVITDGSFGNPPPEFLDRLNLLREEPGLQVIAIVVASAPGRADDFADHVYVVNDLTDRNQVGAAFGHVL